uniref:Uncharacterized protein n=1 Tax=Rhizophora mucronata TaxID=61149 RepID=A0A2P2QJT5_RHIMU
MEILHLPLTYQYTHIAGTKGTNNIKHSPWKLSGRYYL